MNKPNIKELFLGMQKKMQADLQMSKDINHPGTKGDFTEINWIKWFTDYFPKRYNFCNGIVIDHTDNTSDQIDIIVYDKQYSPLVFNQNDVTYITAESVFAVFEVKQTLNKEHLEYAGKKAESVRKLSRTSAPIVYSTGIKPPKEPHKIITGLLTTSNEWKNPIDETLIGNLKSLNKMQELDIICSIQNFAYRIIYENDAIKLEKNRGDDILIFLFLTLLMQLQIIGTVPAIEYNKYFDAVPLFSDIGAEYEKNK